MHRNLLIEQIREKGSYLCVGLDTDMEKIPAHLRTEPDAIFLFNKAIIDATRDHCVSYKINTAFYESLGTKGWDIMERTVNYIPSTHLKIADAKRGDIGNSSAHYAKAFFETLRFDAITVAPYMGEDSVRPFLEYENKWTIVLGLTSNAGASDFELQQVAGNGKDAKAEMLYEKVIRTVSSWGSVNNLMFVTGATQAAALKKIREIIPEHFLLVPGVGFQGGSLAEVSENGLNNECGLLVNASRAVIYAGNKESFADEAKEIARQYQNEMKELLQSALPH